MNAEERIQGRVIVGYTDTTGGTGLRHSVARNATGGNVVFPGNHGLLLSDTQEAGPPMTPQSQPLPLWALGRTPNRPSAPHSVETSHTHTSDGCYTSPRLSKSALISYCFRSFLHGQGSDA